MLGGAGDDVPFYENWRGHVHEDANLVALSALTNTERTLMQTRYQNAPVWTYTKNANAAVRVDSEAYVTNNNSVYLGHGENNCGALLYPLHIIYIRAAQYARMDRTDRITFECVAMLGHIGYTYFYPLIGLAAFPHNISDTTRIETTYPHVGFVSYTNNQMRASSKENSITYGSQFAITGGEYWHHFKIVYIPGTSAVFSCNGTTVATITTNLPTASRGMFFRPVFQVFQQNDDAVSYMRVASVRYYRQNGA
jgi:hypothetical protein